MAFCGACGTSLSRNPSFCGNCGTPVSGAQNASKQSPAVSEQPLLEEGGIFISTSRFVAGSQTYAVSGITSVRAQVEHPSKKGPVITIVVGTFFVLSSFVAAHDAYIGFLIGLPLMALGVWAFRRRVPLYSVVLRSASGEQKATTSTNKELIQRLIGALNQAIIARG
jgi:hypothetical protein